MRKVIFLALSLVLLLLLIPAGCLVRRSSGTEEPAGFREAEKGGVILVLKAADGAVSGSGGGLL